MEVGLLGKHMISQNRCMLFQVVLIHLSIYIVFICLL